MSLVVFYFHLIYFPYILAISHLPFIKILNSTLSLLHCTP